MILITIVCKKIKKPQSENCIVNDEILTIPEEILIVPDEIRIVPDEIVV